MAEKNFYDEIVDCLLLTRRNTPAVTVSDEVMKEFMTDMPPRKKPDSAETAASRVPLPPVRQTPAPSAPPAGFSAGTATMGWDELEAAVSRCRACRLCETRHNVVFEDGSRQARLLFFGEGPGADEDAQGIPFVGRAGELLTKMIPYHCIPFPAPSIFPAMDCESNSWVFSGKVQSTSCCFIPSAI